MLSAKHVLCAPATGFISAYRRILSSRMAPASATRQQGFTNSGYAGLDFIKAAFCPLEFNATKLGKHPDFLRLRKDKARVSMSRTLRMMASMMGLYHVRPRNENANKTPCNEQGALSESDRFGFRLGSSLRRVRRCFRAVPRIRLHRPAGRGAESRR